MNSVPEVTFGPGALAVLGGYLVVMLGLGFLGRLHQKERSLRDFYLAGSSFGFAVLFLTLFATQYSGNTLLGFAGRSYQQGTTYVVSVTFMVLVITVFMIYAPRLFHLARRFGYITPADFVYHRFGSHPLRILCVALLCWGLANYVLEQLVAMGHGVEALSGGRMSFMQGVLLLVGVMLIYESLGGMRAVAWTDVVQGSLLLCGCAVILYTLVTVDGGLATAADGIRATTPAKLEGPDAQGLRSWVSTLLMLGLGVALYPHAIQRIFAARDETSLRRSLGAMAFMPLGTTLLAFLIGFIALSRFPGLSELESDKVTIYVLGGLIDRSPVMYWLIVMVFAGSGRRDHVDRRLGAALDGLDVHEGHLQELPAPRSQCARDADRGQDVLVGRDGRSDRNGLGVAGDGELNLAADQAETRVHGPALAALLARYPLATDVVLGRPRRHAPGHGAHPGHLVRRDGRSVGHPKPLGRRGRRLGAASELRRLRRLDDAPAVQREARRA